MAESVPRAVAALVVLVTACAGAGLCVAASVAPSWAEAILDADVSAARGLGAGAGVVAAAVVVAAVLLRRCRARLGGVTGDVLGACVELGVTAGLVVLAAAG